MWVSMRWLFTSCLVLGLGSVGCGPDSKGSGDGGLGVDASGGDCSDGQRRCSGNAYEICSDGQWATAQECETACNADIGCVVCSPGNDVCSNGNVHSCTATGEIGPLVTECTGQEVCQSGQCVNACEEAAENRSYTGCEYWAVDLDNAVEVIGTQGSFDCLFTTGVKNATLPVCVSGSTVAGLCDPPGNSCPAGYTCQTTAVCVLDAQGSPFAIVVSNPQERAVDVTVTGPNNETFTRTVAAGQVQALMPQPMIPDQSIDGTGTARKAYKVTSTLPIIAYQFNPLDNVNVFSNDASLLIPRTAFDTEYYVMSYPTLDRRATAPGAHRYHGYLSIVAWEDGTEIEVTPKVAVQASATQASIAAGTPTTFSLNAHEVLTLQAAGAGDLTGTRVRSTNDKTFGVFGGHEAALFGESTPPSPGQSGPCCADHIEEMLFPTSTWGKSFAITRSQSRGTNEPDLLRIMAQKAGTTVTFTPPPVSGSCNTLGAGEFCQVKISGDTAITANEPILVGHYLQSAIWQDFLGGAVGEGDPSMAIAVPTEQYRNDYTILVPNAYAKNYLSISTPAGGTVFVDGVQVALTPFANNTYAGTRMLVTAGQHKIRCPSGCGITVYGYSDAVSYMFAGGLDLKQIVIQ
jgi:hypothetical protein